MSTKTLDVYDYAIELASKKLGTYDLHYMWGVPRIDLILGCIQPTNVIGHLLFRFPSKSGKSEGRENDKCLTMIRRCNTSELFTDLQMRILQDGRIPKDVGEIKTIEDLEVFAEWQRKIDQELGRNPLKFLRDFHIDPEVRIPGKYLGY